MVNLMSKNLTKLILMVNLMANFGTKLILMVNLMREKFNQLTISGLFLNKTFEKKEKISGYFCIDLME